MPPQPRNREPAPRKAPPKPSPERRKAILAILLLTAGLLVLVALASYDVTDESFNVRGRDLWGTLTGNEEARQKADQIHNALGLTGAWLADGLIKSTIGYSVYALPLLMLYWGWTMLRRREYGPAVQLTNYVAVAAVLASAAFGLTRLIIPASGPGMEWSGIIGDFLALLLARLLGRTGGAIIVTVLLLLTIILAIDLDIHRTIDRLRAAALHGLDWLARMRDRWAESRETRRAEREAAAEAQAAAEEETEKKPDRAAPAPVKITRPADEEPEESDDAPEEEEEPRPRPQPVIKRTPEPPPAPVAVAPKKPLAIAIERAPEENGEEDVNPDAPPPDAGVTEDIDYVFPSVDLLDPPKPGREDVNEEELRANADRLRDTLLEFDVEVDSVSVTPGPVITLYELVPSSGVKINRIVSLENDIALKLAARGIRIIAPIPGKSAVGVEIPNSQTSLVTVRSVINSNAYRESQATLPLAMGKTIAGEVFTDDLSRMPHLLMAGSTGSGKSVGINTILTSLLYRMHPSSLKLVLVDPKKIELSQYKELKDHFLARSPDVSEEIITTPPNAVLMLKGVEIEMERRYERLAAAGVRNIADYNERVKSRRLKDTDTVIHTKMPYLVVVIDELADLMITAAREVEEPIARLAQLARAVGIHLIVATQRPSVDVITGVIKANFPARVAYQVASKIDSRTILDMNGAEQLLGNGDMLYLASGSPKPVRLQNSYISPDEVERVVGHVSKQKGYATPFMLPSAAERKRAGAEGDERERDELFEEAARLIVRHQQGSVSLLQRRLSVGYSRAARLVDELEMAGIVGPFDGSKARQVLVESMEELETLLHGQ
ncbi:MAG TPA: DNA translocase FtsK 4TM domain-containing protein [Bacteroidota bacterium]